MKFATWIYSGQEEAGIFAKDLQSVHSFESMGLPYTTVLQYIVERKEKDLTILQESELKAGTPVESVALQAPIPKPHHDILCLGVNYLDHAQESEKFGINAGKDAEAAVYFSKRVVRALEPGGVVENHADIEGRLDYEAELAVIIGKDARNVKSSDAWDYIFGVCCFNDLSARDLQRTHQQWYFGKSLDTFTAFGPYIVTLDEFELPLALSICSRVNNETRQQSNTSKFIHPIPEVIEELTRGMTLDAGSIIATGTPAGVGAAFDPPRCMHKGDVCEIEIEGCGVLVNRVG
jgi:2-keto-4-pentenoate hydratase/2-oxohepta-3-ene-1,7-dioic acid hydratase in catechol pathway